MKPKFRIGLLGYCILGIAVLVLMVFEIMDGNGPMIGLDAVLLAFIASALQGTMHPQNDRERVGTPSGVACPLGRTSCQRRLARHCRDVHNATESNGCCFGGILRTAAV